MYKLLQHKTASTILMLGIWVIGVMSYLNMPSQVYPTVDENMVMVDVVLPKLSVSEIEERISMPLERRLRGAVGLDNITTVSSEGMLNAFVTFNDSTSSDKALSTVTQIVNDIVPPNSERKVTYYENLDSVANIAIKFSGNKVDHGVINRFVRELSDMGVVHTRLVGVPDSYSYLNFDSQFLQRHNISTADIREQILKQLEGGTLGSVGEGAKKVFLEMENNRNPSNIQKKLSHVIITTDSGQYFNLLDIAKYVEHESRDVTRVYLNSERVFELKVLRGEGQSLDEVQSKMHSWAESTHIPDNVSINIFNEEWKNIQERMDMMNESGISGLLLVLVVLVLILNKSIAIWVAAGIPTAFSASFILLNSFGISLNLLTVFGLIMSLGIVVDDAILIAEKALKEINDGKNKTDAIKTSIKKMLTPLMASSLTTVAAFLPLTSIAGPLGGMVEIIPIVMTCVIAASLVEVFIILPSHLNNSKINSNAENSRNKWFSAIEDKFTLTASFCMRHKYFTLLLSLISVAGVLSTLALGLVNFTFQPDIKSNSSVIYVEFEDNATSSEQRDFLSGVENQYLSLANEYDGKPTKVVTHEGRGQSSGNLEFVSFEKAEMFVFYEPREKVDVGVTDEQWVDNFVSSINLPRFVKSIKSGSVVEQGSASDLTVSLQAENPQVLSESVNELKKLIEDKESVSEVVRNNTDIVTVYDVQLTEAAKRKGIVEADVKLSLQNALNSELVTTLSVGVFSHDILLGIGDKLRYESMLPEDVPVFINGQAVRLGDIAIITPVMKESNVMRVNGVRSAELEITLKENSGVSALDIYSEIEAELIPLIQEKYPVMYGLSGNSQHEAQAMSDVMRNGFIAVMLIYIVLSIAFSSYTKPLLVMLIIPFSVVGSIFGHFIMGYDFNVLSVLSMFGLSGIVVNNTIAIIYEYDHLKQNFNDKALALIIATKSRFRSILVTTVTTIAGLLPLLLSQSVSADFLKPMAISIVFGLLFTILMVFYTFPAILMIGVNTKGLKADTYELINFFRKKIEVIDRITKSKSIDPRKLKIIESFGFMEKEKVYRIHNKLNI